MLAFEFGIKQSQIGAHQVGGQAIDRGLEGAMLLAAAMDQGLVIAGERRIAADGKGGEIAREKALGVAARIALCLGANPAPVAHRSGIARSAHGRSIGLLRQNGAATLERGQRALRIRVRPARKLVERRARQMQSGRRRLLDSTGRKQECRGQNGPTCLHSGRSPEVAIKVQLGSVESRLRSKVQTSLTLPLANSAAKVTVISALRPCSAEPTM